MAKRKAEEGGGGSPAWMSTFSDLMNLLLCFFVLLFSMSSVDAEKFQEVAASLASSFSVLPAGGSAITDEGILVGSGASQLTELSTYYNNMGLNNEGETDITTSSAYEEVNAESLKESEKMAEQIEQALKESNLSEQVNVEANSRYVVLNMNGALLFDSGKADLKQEAISVLSGVADSIKQYDNHIISIEGHTDSNPINTSQFPDNMVLSMYRAYSVFDYFVKDKEFDSATMTSTGRGDAVPVASNATPEGRAQNRRVEIKIYNSLNS